MAPPPGEMRLDKWLWAARFFKTRALAVEAVERQRVQVNGQGAKPGRDVRVGDRIALTQTGWVREVEILGLSLARGPAPVAQALYRDSEASLRAAAEYAERRRLAPEPAATIEQGRPTKRDRRALQEWDRWSAHLDE
ncbi:ribosome-associated heat shock protein Hsp15 [Inhella inkyongensis]|uniref:Ribosome-associated heat shock protein Hsp15 n=1 Tax=Inhella inkyongensis TaxID=392593 RepID=A0A840SCA0_9BURK|nr:RNA-binding S4 domain-containing protein [Inhella inkyongensis]MBB5205959.1 ribosome-associated heat shock protein Hsp15 [Inhella inkyongensis]